MSDLRIGDRGFRASEIVECLPLAQKKPQKQ
jgi:hypothetical protein